MNKRNKTMVSPEDLNARLNEYRKGEAYRAGHRQALAFREAENSPANKKIPQRPNFKDGVSRYNDGVNNIGILRENAKYTIYDYNSKQRTRQLSYTEAREVLESFHEGTGAEAVRAAAESDPKVITEKRKTSNSERYAIKTSTDGNIFVDVDNSPFTQKSSPQEIAAMLAEIVRTKFNDFIQVKGQKIGINQKTAREWVRSKSAVALMNNNRVAFAHKANAFENADELLIAARDYVGEARKHGRKDNFAEFARGIVNFKVGNIGYEADIIVGTTQSGTAVLYDLVDIKEKKIVAKASYAAQDRRSDAPATANSIPQNAEKINPSDKNSSESDEKTAKSAKKTKYQEQTEAADKLASENVKEYSSLPDEDKVRVRKVIRQARAKSFSESDTLLLARVAAKSGLDIEISEKKCIRTELDENGKEKTVTVDGLYDVKTGRIVINPNGTRSAARILGHEAFHAIFGGLKNSRQGAKALARVVYAAAQHLDTPDGKNRLTKAERIELAYRNQSDEVILEELGAHFVECFTDEGFMRELVGESPSLKDKFLSFFGGAVTAYSDDARLASAARKYRNLYKKMFDALAAYKNSERGVMIEALAANSDALTSKNSENVKVSGENDGTRAAVDIDNKGENEYNYTKEQYESFGWASEAGGITTEELDDLFAKIKSRTGLKTFKQSSRGEAIIEVNNDPHKTLGVDNVFVFVKGTRNNFRIARTVRFDAETETEMEILKERLYERRAFSDTHLAYLEQQGFATQYTREGAKSFSEYQELRESRKTSRGTNQDNRGQKQYRGGYSLDIGENGEITEKYALDLTSEDTSLGYISTAYGGESGLGRITEQIKSEGVGATAKGIYESGKETLSTGILSTQILFTNEQAGIEKAGKALGVDNVEELVQQMRA